MMLGENEKQFARALLMREVIYNGSSNECCHF